jgi:glycosyltransferase involved in cell wall biosynthesis
VARAAAAGIEDVSAFAGRIPHAEFATALNAGDVFISVPSVDATAVSLLEAMSCGRAIVVSDLPSATEWIEHEQSGLVVPPRDVDALAAALLRLAAGPEERRDFGERARAIAGRHADFESNMQRVERIFRCLLGEDSEWPRDVVLTRLAPSGGESA